MRQIVNIAIGLIVEQHDQLRGIKPPQRGQLLLQSVIEYPAIGWQVDLSSRLCVCEQPFAFNSGTVAQHRTELSRRALQKLSEKGGGQLIG